MSKSIDISDMFTEQGLAKIKQGQLLCFEKADIIITKINRKSKKVYARIVKAYKMDGDSVIVSDEDGNLSVKQGGKDE